MPFLGVEPTQEFSSVAKQSVTGDGSVSYTLNKGVSDANDLAVFVNDVRQEPGSAYTALGNTITFTANLESTDDCYILHIGRAFSSAQSPGITDNATQKVITITTDGHIVPTANVTQDLGTSDLRFRDIYLSGSSIKLGSHSITSNATHVAIGDLAFSNTISGDGSDLTSLNASELTTGTLPDARFPATLPAANGTNLTSLNATEITTGTIDNARLPSDISVVNDLTVAGDLFVNGNTTTIAASELKVEDSLIQLASNNEVSDSVDIGFVGHYNDGSTQVHTGFFRDASDEQYYLFKGYEDTDFDTDTPPAVIDRTANTFSLAALNVGAFTSTGIDDNATSTAITIDSIENVGLGVGTPGAKLHVKSQGAVAGVMETTGTESYISFLTTETTATNETRIGLVDDNEFVIKTGGSTHLTLKSDGILYTSNTVAINIPTTENTSGKLQVRVAANTNIAFNTYGGEARISAIDDAISVGIPLIIQGTPLKIQSGGAERMVILSGGNVGINDVAPSNLLTLKGGSQYQGLAIKNGSGGLIGELVGFASGNDAGGLKLWSGGAAKVQLISNGLSYITGGNVSIGTTTNNTYNLLQVGGVTYSDMLTTSIYGVIGHNLFYANSSWRYGANGYGYGWAQTGTNGSDLVLYRSAENSSGHGAAATGHSEVMRINSSGHISMEGDLQIDGTFTESSALRYKENIQDLEYNNIISKLKPKIYNKIGQEKQEVGLIAEEVEVLDKNLVTYNEEGEVEGIQYTRLVPHLITHIQKLEERLDALENG